MTSKSIQNLLDWLEVKGFLQNRNVAEAYLLCEQNVSHIPIYIHILMGIGALIGCGFISALLFALDILSAKNYSYIIASISFIVLALILYYPFRHSKPLLHSFSMQSSLIFMIIGKTLFVVGIEQHFPLKINETQSAWTITLALLFITLLTYFIFPNVIDRFLSCLATLLSLFYNLLHEFSNNIPLFIVFVGSLATLYALYIWRDRPKTWDPFVMVWVIYLCSISIFLSNYSLISEVPSEVFWKIPPIIFNLTIAIFLVALCFHFAGSISNITDLSFIFSCVGLILLSLISNAGILWSIGLLMLGYGKHQRSLVTFGVVFLIWFLIEYYYNLSTTLQHKSFLLMGSGVFLLVLRSVMKYLNWDKD